MSKIVWLASYPKSGNTWLRVFLANFQEDRDSPVHINELTESRTSSSRKTADEALGVECSDLTTEEVDRYRPDIYRYVADRSEKELVFVKAHDAYTTNADAAPIIPRDVTQAALYVVRNPLDVAVSYARYQAKTLDFAIDQMASETVALSAREGRLSLHLPQRLLSWSGHVRSWLDQTGIPVHVMRYEDMCRQPVETFGAALRFLDLDDRPERLKRAVSFSTFDMLRQQELASGFKERPYETVAFFRRGGYGEWRELLTQEQVKRVISDHGTVMKRLGYWSESGVIE